MTPIKFCGSYLVQSTYQSRMWIFKDSPVVIWPIQQTKVEHFTVSFVALITTVDWLQLHCKSNVTRRRRIFIATFCHCNGTLLGIELIHNTAFKIIVNSLSPPPLLMILLTTACHRQKDRGFPGRWGWTMCLWPFYPFNFFSIQPLQKLRLLNTRPKCSVIYVKLSKQAQKNKN